MKTTKRSKMLLSSIAMLLVALVALGSASFAWYVTQDTVYAKQAKFKAATAEGLVIKHATTDANWVQEINFNDGSSSSLSPASTNYSTSEEGLIAATGQGTSVSNGALKAGTLTKAEITDTSKFYVDHCYVASSATATNAYMKIEGKSQAGTYINVLVYADGTLVGAYTSDPTANLKTSTIKADTNDADERVVDATDYALTTLGKGANAIKVATPFSADTMANDGTEITVVAFADGFNSKCTNVDADPTVIDLDISFKTSAWS